VAIPALVAFAIYQNKTDQLVNQLTTLTSEIFHDLLFLSGKRPAVTVANAAHANATQPHPMN
jgi:hypothetical protein